MNLIPTGLYVHVPFCMKLCPYCAFYKVPVNKDLESVFLKNGLDEIDWYAQQYGRIPVDTIYFGGGTPNVLAKATFEQLVSAIYDRFNVADECEFTMEVNPGVHAKSKLNFFKDMGVNRLSIGAQSFNQVILDEYGRNHTVSDTLSFIDQVGEVGIDNVNVDIIFGHPIQTNAQLKDSLETFLNYGFDHLAIYALAVEPNTPFSAQGLEVNNDHQADQYQLIQQVMLDNGYEHYEVSNFCKPGRMAVHNAKYLLSQPTIGLGAGAHSFFDGRRYENMPDIEQYLNQLPMAIANADLNGWPDYIGARLRLRQPLLFKDIFQQFGIDVPKQFSSELHKMADLGVLDVSEDAFMITHQGFLVLDEVLGYFI